MYVRVAISKKANEIDFQDTNKMIDHLLIYNTTILLIVEDLVSLFGFWAEVCCTKGEDSILGLAGPYE